MKTVSAMMLSILLAAPGLAGANGFHPTFPLLDAHGEQVLLSGAALSQMNTCGACHNAEFIRDSSDHMQAGVFGDDELQCLSCHSDFELPRAWDYALFNPDGSIDADILNVHKPRDRNCANCHSVVDNRLDTPLTVSPDPKKLNLTDRTGQIISAQKIVNSGLNIAGKNTLTHPFDVHADRVVGCVNCHYSLNNPVYYRQRDESRPDHLAFDPRRLSSADYLERPLHQLAKGSSSNGRRVFGSENSMRRCESCHQATTVHDWLPYKQRHFESLACESCHIPKLYGPAVQTEDWSLVDADGNPRREYRQVDGDPASADSLIHGFRPVILARENVGGQRKLAPFNLVSSWYWTAGDAAERIGAEQLVDILYQDGALSPEIALADSVSERNEAIRQRLLSAGFVSVKLQANVTPYPVSHNVVNGRWATRDCRTCHDADSILGAAFPLAASLPDGQIPSWAVDSGAEADGQFAFTAGGGAVFLPSTRVAGYYVLGLDHIPWIDLAGLVLFFGVVLGVSVHGFIRFVANRRWGAPTRPTRRVRMYDAYERIWHWLQASAILLLLFTGLIIHKPHIFGIFNFAYVVQVHNVLGFILLINAALALFYTLASGTIRRFFPDPDGFFARAFEQALFYSRGIFAGAAHPLEKTPQNRLNPLQQVTYLAILNILLPAQVVTGVLIWGLQEWPQLGAALGGLPLLAPVHTLLAWAFAAFIVMHVYLTTTGETPLAGIRAMVTGWEDIESHDMESTAKEHAHD